MINGFRKGLDLLGIHRQEKPVMVAGVATQHEMDTCLEALLHKGIKAEGRSTGRGTLEIWAPANQEPEARLLLGLSGRSVLRLRRQRRRPILRRPFDR